jgi:anti-sigma regulatory factor (Ser/Thr protein kinase)
MVVLPDRLEATRVRRLVDCTHKMETESGLLLDASHVVFAHPYGLVLLCSAALRRAANGLAPVTVLPARDEGVDAFFREVGFYDFLTTGVGGSGTLALQRLPSNTLMPTYAQHIAELMQKVVPDTQEPVAWLVKQAVNEVLQNVIEHAASSTDTVLLTRWYQRDNNLRIAISDSGRGVAESMRMNPKNGEATDAALVRRAVLVDGTSGRTSGREGGLGLKRIRDLCLVRGGKIHITSRRVDAEYSSSSQWEKPELQLHGSTIEVDFRPGAHDGSSSDIPSTEDWF